MRAVERLHKGHFAEEANIFDKDTLVRLAGDAGLDRIEVASMLAGDKFKTDVEADEEAARQMGASSVPFFLIKDQFPVQGSQAREQIPAILDQAWKAQSGSGITFGRAAMNETHRPRRKPYEKQRKSSS